MDRGLLGAGVEKVAETILKAGYGALIDLEWFLIERGVIGVSPRPGIYEDYPENLGGEIH